jgi:hypothetical protein
MPEVAVANVTVFTHVCFLVDKPEPDGRQWLTVQDINPARDAARAPEGAYAFYYYNTVTCDVDVDGTVVHAQSARFNNHCLRVINSDAFNRRYPTGDGYWAS